MTLEPLVADDWSLLREVDPFLVAAAIVVRVAIEWDALALESVATAPGLVQHRRRRGRRRAEKVDAESATAFVILFDCASVLPVSSRCLQAMCPTAHDLAVCHLRPPMSCQKPSLASVVACALVVAAAVVVAPGSLFAIVPRTLTNSRTRPCRRLV